MRVEKNAIGCSIWEVDAKTLARSEMHEVKDLLYRNRLIVLKEQTLADQQYCDFAGRFGFPVPYLQENYRHPDYPLIFVSSNVKKDGKPIGVPRTGGYWHSDTSFETEPKVITMLMPKVLPQNFPRGTRFIDMAAVYAALHQATRDKLAGARCRHSGRWRYKVRAQDIGMDMFEILQMIDSVAHPVLHPAVIEHQRPCYSIAVSLTSHKPTSPSCLPHRLPPPQSSNPCRRWVAWDTPSRCTLNACGAMRAWPASRQSARR